MSETGYSLQLDQLSTSIIFPQTFPAYLNVLMHESESMRLVTIKDFPVTRKDRRSQHLFHSYAAVRVMETYLR